MNDDFDAIQASASPEVNANNNFQSLNWALVYSKRQSTTSGLVWGYRGGRWGGFEITAATLALSDNSDNYIVVNRSTGAISVESSDNSPPAPINWNDTTNYARVYKVTCLSGVVSALEDHRAGPGGAHGTSASAGAGTELKGLTFTSDTGSTADSDPGNGLFKWNNATQASATVLYFDNQTLDAISLTTLFAGLASSGYIYMQQADDATKWQEWKWSAVVDGTGYRKFTVTLQASGGSIADNKTVYVDFESSGSGGTIGRHSIPIPASSMSPSFTGGCAPLAKIASAANQPDIVTLDFDQTTQEYAQFAIFMPKSWNEGTISFKPIWSHAAAASFGVVFDLQAVAVSNDDVIAQAFGTAQTSTDTGGTTNDLYVGPESSAITVAGSPAAEDIVFFRISRVTGDGGDTLDVDARLHGIILYITTDAETDV